MKNLSRKEWIAASVAVLFVAYMFFGAEIMSLFNSSNLNSQQANIMNVSNEGLTGGVTSQDLIIGTGAEVETGSEVGVNYVLRLADGTVIQDSKAVGGQAFKFIAGAGQLIPGWEMGILGMRAGGKRIITIPPELGYGSQQVGPIPANSTLIFEIEVVSVEAGN